MSVRIDYPKVDPAAVRAMLGLEQYVRDSGIEQELLDLVKLRASYINGCAFCADMHTKDARAAGETEQRLYAVPVAIVAINGWNRLAVGFRTEPGTYQPRADHRETIRVA
jgi:AhpD family alkylhydroperoxidase